MAASLPVTVIMRSKNSDWVIGSALAALFAQEFSDFDLLLVDSGSTDKTLQVAKRYPHRLHQIAPGSYFPGAVLNEAIGLCSSPLVVFLNSDCVPLCKKTLGRLVSAFDNADTVAAFGRQIPRPDADAWVRRDYAQSFPACGTPPDWITLSLPIAALRRSVWARHPFYDSAWGSEDTEWGNWARKHGLTIAYVADAIAMHSHNYSLRQLYGRRFIEGEADAFIYDRRPKSLAPAYRAAASALRDVAFGLQNHAAPADLLLAPIRRTTGEWAYYRGRKWGTLRRERGDQNAAAGQQIVLARHESVRSPQNKKETT